MWVEVVIKDSRTYDLVEVMALQVKVSVPPDMETNAGCMYIQVQVETFGILQSYVNK